MTEAEKMAQRLEERAQNEDIRECAEAAALIREQEAKIKRMAEALRDFDHAAYGRGTEDLRERHAEALRDAGVGG